MVIYVIGLSSEYMDTQTLILNSFFGKDLAGSQTKLETTIGSLEKTIIVTLDPALVQVTTRNSPWMKQLLNLLHLRFRHILTVVRGYSTLLHSQTKFFNLMGKDTGSAVLPQLVDLLLLILVSSRAVENLLELLLG